mmetsp:Transcript_7098/g.10171  ORF Transcript_7098/g.10171 Transcript_7098/m.10171 type:complete len:573 (-) Transcript_7098:48-1766(-)|eukprot:CAMPEP_0184863752 /NCGR_PEP_ID=MMETSP0580-20130426/12287_1 /TAXON_ID=1118495 /ORGANISM="Dactyliosolen fragilissimus" /LENGTH=572 /DNA_ID=CAMNT_0027362259 /DNA_START=81 /DNA_END=1799 /DNA_ORIENTATION=-
MTRINNLKYRQYRKSSKFLVIILTSLCCDFLYPYLPFFTDAATNANADTSSSSTTASSTTSEIKLLRRERNLDHWDAETFAHYAGLDITTFKPLEMKDGMTSYAGIDASVMFYAQWCKNCRRFAPVWDAIATLLHAGTTKGNIIMALFNCELDNTHAKLCDAAGVNQYPTLLYIGSGNYHDVDPVTSVIFGGKDKAAGPAGSAKLDRTVKFQGNLNLGDSVLDWVKTMRGLSTWHRWNHGDSTGKPGWLGKIRRGIWDTVTLGIFTSKDKRKTSTTQLPVGIPYGSVNGPISSFPTSSQLPSQKELDDAQNKIKSLESKVQIYKDASTHGGYLIESFLFPQQVEYMSNGDQSLAGDGKYSELSNHTKETRIVDIFDVMTKNNTWHTDTNSFDKSSLNLEEKNDILIKSCFVDLTLDYCKRLSTKVTNDYIDTLKNVTDLPSFATMESEVKNLIEKEEPYCSGFYACVKAQFQGDDEIMKKCRPSSCPFRNDNACTYVASCMSKNIQAEYHDAVFKFDEELNDENAKTTSTNTTSESSSTKQNTNNTPNEGVTSSNKTDKNASTGKGLFGIKK